MLFVVLGAYGGIRDDFAKYFMNRGFTLVKKYSLKLGNFNPVAKFAPRDFLSEEEFNSSCDLSYEISELGIRVGFAQKQIIDAVRGVENALLTVSTTDIGFIRRLKDRYAGYVTTVFCYIDNHTLESTLCVTYGDISDEQVMRRLNVGKAIKKLYSENIDLFDYTLVYDGEADSADMDKAYRQFDKMITLRKQRELYQNNLRYPSLPYEGPEPYIFISYAHRDRKEDSDRVNPILWKLQQNGFRVWYDDGLVTGMDWDRQISERIKGSSVFVLIMSEYAVASENVLAEANYAKKHGKKIIIVNLDNTDIDSGLFEGFAMYYMRNQQLLKANFQYPQSEKRQAFYKKLFHDLDQTTRESVPAIDD